MPAEEGKKGKAQRRTILLPPPIVTCGFPTMGGIRPHVFCDAMNRFFSSPEAAVGLVTRGSSVSCAFSSFSRKTIESRTMFSLEEAALPDGLRDEAEFSAHLEGRWLSALRDLFVGTKKILRSTDPLFSSGFFPYARAWLSAEKLSSTLDVPVVACPSCGKDLTDFSERIEPRLLLNFAVADLILLAEIRKPQDAFAACALWVDPSAAYARWRSKGNKNVSYVFLRERLPDFSAQLGEGSVEMEFTGKDLLASAAKNPVTEEFVPIIPGKPGSPTGISVCSPGTDAGDLSGLRVLSSSPQILSQSGLSQRKLEEVQVKFPARDGMFTEVCGRFHGLPVGEGAPLMRHEFLRSGAACEFLEPARGECGFCGARLLCAVRADSPVLLFSSKSWSDSISLVPAAAGMLAQLPSGDRPPSDPFLFSAFHLLCGLPAEKSPPPVAFDYLFGKESNFNSVLKSCRGVLPKEALLSARQAAGLVFSEGPEGSSSPSSFFVFSGKPERWPSDLCRLSSAMLEPAQGPKGFIKLPFLSSHEPLSALLSAYGGEAVRLSILLAGPRKDSECGTADLRAVSERIQEIRKLVERIAALPVGGASSGQAEDFLGADAAVRIARAHSAMESLMPREALLSLFSGFSAVSTYLRRGGMSRDAADAAVLNLAQELSPLAPALCGELLDGRSAPEIGTDLEKVRAAAARSEFLSCVLADIGRAVRRAAARKEAEEKTGNGPRGKRKNKTSRKERRPISCTLVLAEKWKYDFLSAVEYAVKDGLDPEIFTRAFAKRGRREAEFAADFFRNRLPGKRRLALPPHLLAQQDEFFVLSEAKGVICTENGISQLEIVKSDDLKETNASERSRMRNSMPWKPAIIILYALETPKKPPFREWRKI